MLKAVEIHKIYKDGKRELHVLKGIDLEVRKDEVVAIVGPSGAGKSTFLHILGGIDRPSSGKVLVNNADFYAMSDGDRAWFRNQKIGFVFQFYHLLPEFTALENAMMPALVSHSAYRIAHSVREKTKELLQELGLGERLNHRPSELSGGERQRVAIARAIINSPEILLCDEPTGNLDSEIGREVLGILFSLNKKNRTAVIIVTHDREIASRADTIIELRDGRIIK